MTYTTNIRLPDDLGTWLTQYSQETGVPRNTVVRKALEEYASGNTCWERGKTCDFTPPALSGELTIAGRYPVPEKPVKAATKRLSTKAIRDPRPPMAGTAASQAPKTMAAIQRIGKGPTPQPPTPEPEASEEEVDAYLEDCRQAAKKGLSVEQYRELLLAEDPDGHVWGA